MAHLRHLKRLYERQIDIVGGSLAVSFSEDTRISRPVEWFYNQNGCVVLEITLLTQQYSRCLFLKGIALIALMELRSASST